jgi:hypothetical protein
MAGAALLWTCREHAETRSRIYGDKTLPPNGKSLWERSTMKRKSFLWQMLSAAFLAALLTSRVAPAEGDFFVEGMKAHDGKLLKVDLWKSDLAAKVCEVDSLTLLYGQGSQVERDETGQPRSCGAKEKVARLTHGTRVNEIPPSDSCNTRHPPGAFRRVRVLDGPDVGKIGCINSSALVRKDSP